METILGLDENICGQAMRRVDHQADVLLVALLEALAACRRHHGSHDSLLSKKRPTVLTGHVVSVPGG
jgi:hypothetical protein